MSFAFFRKYNKLLLAVGGSVLMVLFLIPQAASTMFRQPGDQVIGTLAGTEITGNEAKSADGEITVLRALLQSRYGGLVQQYQQAASKQDYQTAFMARQELQSIASTLGSLPDGDHAGVTWMMMLHEAHEQGLYASRSESRLVLQDWGITPQLLAQVKQQYKIDDAFIYQALSHWQTTMRLRQLAFGQAIIPGPGGSTFSMRLSEPALRHFARNSQSKVGLDLVAIPASIMLDDIDEPTEAEITERFKRSAAVPPGPQNKTQYGFGYLISPRVKLEYIAVPLQRAKQAITVDEVESQRYYLEHPDEFLPKPEKSDDGADSSAPESSDPSKPASTEPRPYRDVREDIIEKLTDQKAAALQDQAVKLIEASLNAATRSWPLDQQTGYHNVPAGAASNIDFAAIADQVQQATGIQPDVVRDESKWQSINDIADVPEFGNAVLIIGSGNNRRGVPVAAYIASTRELKINNPQLQPLHALHLQVGMPSKPVTNADHNVFIFRVLDAQSAHPPASINEDDIRQKVVHDVKLLKAYGSIQQQAWTFVNRARIAGLEKLADSLGDDIKVQHIDPFPRREFNPQQSNAPEAPDLDIVGQNEQFVDEVFKLVQPAEDAGSLDALKPADRIAAVPVDNKLTVYVVKITDYQPLTEQDYQQQHQLWALRMGVSELTQARVQAGHNPYSYEALATRVGYTPAHQQKSDEDQGQPSKPAEEKSPASPTGKNDE